MDLVTFTREILNPFMTEADMDWFLHDIGLRHERINGKFDFLCSDYYHYYFIHIQVPEKKV